MSVASRWKRFQESVERRASADGAILARISELPNDRMAEVACADCGTRVFPTLTERGDIRCSSCRAARVVATVGSRR